MFFLITHTLVGKYYPSLVTQFLIGCTCYLLFYFIIRDAFSDSNYDQYKYYVLVLIIADASFLLYKTKTTIDSKKVKVETEPVDFVKKSENTSTDLKSGTIQSLSLSSEINDYKVTHDVTATDKESSSIFSDVDEK